MIILFYNFYFFFIFIFILFYFFKEKAEKDPKKHKYDNPFNLQLLTWYRESKISEQSLNSLINIIKEKEFNSTEIPPNVQAFKILEKSIVKTLVN